MSTTCAPEKEKIGYEKGDYDALFLAEVETAFQHSCQWGIDPGDPNIHRMPDCDKAATWLLQARHSLVACPAPEIFLCDEHSEKVLNYWKAFLKIPGKPLCGTCGEVVGTRLKDVLNAIKL